MFFERTSKESVSLSAAQMLITFQSITELVFITVLRVSYL